MMDGSLCKYCEHENYCRTGRSINSNTKTKLIGCSRYEKRKVMTNADRIRSMTDEELAEWLSRHLAVRQEYENNPKRTTAWLYRLREECKE